MKWCSASVLSTGLVFVGGADAAEITVDWTGRFEIPDIVDPPGVFIDIPVDADPGEIRDIVDLDVGLLITHTWQGDLILALEHLDTGTRRHILDRPGSPQAGLFGFSADNYGDLATGALFVLDDEADNPYDMPFVQPQGIPDVTGNWQPDTDTLAGFDGEDASGTWRLWIADQGGGDVGTVRHVRLSFVTVPAPSAMIPMCLALLARRRRR